MLFLLFSGAAEVHGRRSQSMKIPSESSKLSPPVGISFDTVRSHIRRIYEKLQVHSRAQAVAKYVGTYPSKQ